MGGLIDWQASSGKATVYKVASVQVTANVAAAVRTIAGNAVAAPEGAVVVSPTSHEKAAAMQTAAAMLAVGSKRRVLSILSLLTASASNKGGQGGTEFAMKVALQGDGAS